jgi:DNA segregation ATPase FtsK/SpoIIIE, S-DNA-T family
MSSCKFPDHHGNTGKRGEHLALLVVLALIAYAVWLRIRHVVAEVIHWAVIVGLVLVVVAAVVLVARLVLRTRKTGWCPKVPHLSAAWLRHLRRTLWAAVRWHHLARNLGLAAPDRHLQGRIRHPRAWFLPTRHGVAAHLRTVPGTGRAELEKVAEHIADSWRVQRVSVSQPKPGRLVVRGLRRDPLLELIGAGDIPTGRPVRDLYLGRDEHGTHRFADLANVPGICVGGMPGSGKSTEITSWLTQLAPSPFVQHVNLDGKGAGEFADFEPRAWLTEGDNLDGALDKLETVHALMTDRLACVRSVLGVKNAWHVGPSEEWPLIMTTIDECQAYLDATMVKGDKVLEPKVRRCIFLVSSLVRRGRSVMFLTVPATQKPTTDSLPSSIRDNCPISLCFGVKTTDAAAATLGTSIRDYPSYSPVTLADPAYAGCCTVTLKTGQDPFTRLRGPYVTEAEAVAVVTATAHLRRDPRASWPVVVPDDAAELTKAGA